jgi:hypothetical protein
MPRQDLGWLAVLGSSAVWLVAVLDADLCSFAFELSLRRGRRRKMTKCTLGALLVLTLAVPTLAVPMYIYNEGEAPSLQGERINVKQDFLEISASTPTHVQHGNGRILREPTLSMGTEELKALFAACDFVLTVDGVVVPPDCATATAWTGDGQVLWAVENCYEFDEGFFSPGIHILEGKWTLDAFPCALDVGGCHEGGTFAGTHILFTVERDTAIDGLLCWTLTHILTLAVLP